MASPKTAKILAILWALGLCIGTALRVKLGSEAGTTGFRHVALHFLAFAIFGFLLSKSGSTARTRTLLVIAGLSVGFYTEMYEHIVGGSDLEIVDIVVDGIGVLLGAAIQQAVPAGSENLSSVDPL
jgi:glycopeptide antibiotics resistance protein